MKYNTVKPVHSKWLLILGVTVTSAFMPVLAPNASAATLLGNTADALVANGAVAQASDTTITAGSAGFFQQRSYVSVFQLPNLGAIANPFMTASASFTLTSVSGTPWVQVNLRGLDRRTAADVLGSDGGGGTVVGLSLNTGSGAGVKTTTGTALLDYLNFQYDGGLGAGEFVFLSFMPTNFGDTFYTFATADNATALDRPFIDYTAIPEPSTYALLGLGLGALVWLRRRNKKTSLT